ncbi:MAG: hypothetical protein K6B44_07875 [Lachnospiraceae bacterium]|nr:hypothetical protein [Lachnospiraceae bacterium]
MTSELSQKLYQLCDKDEGRCDAWGKAPRDMSLIADSLGFERVNIRMQNESRSVAGFIKRHFCFVKDYIRAYRKIERNGILLMQHPLYEPLPFRYLILRLLKKKNVKFISQVIDVEKLRDCENTFLKHEFEFMFRYSEVIIVHNKRMLEWFVSKGMSRDRLVDVEIFDNIGNAEIKKPVFEKSITVAGGLKLKKSGYLRFLGGVTDYPVHLYGPVEKDENIMQYFTAAKYHGVFPSDELAEKLLGGFGLVWDGEAAEGGTGSYGEYLKYNDPHKLGLYLSAGIPVIVWKESAAALFVEKYKVGLCIGNLNEIADILNNISEEEWKLYSENALIEGEKIRKGEHFRNALVSALDKLKKQ